MSEVKKRKVHGADFKAKVGLEAIRGLKTLNEIGQTIVDPSVKTTERVI
ncbi:MAG: hypothetical protein ACOYMW_15205 [Candidatus Competibacteraceae bacterium]